MKKIRTIGEIEAITRFMYEIYASNNLFIDDTYDEIEEQDRYSWRESVKSLLNHLETVEELELKK
jgi:hypothetical protein